MGKKKKPPNLRRVYEECCATCRFSEISPYGFFTTCKKYGGVHVDKDYICDDYQPEDFYTEEVRVGG